MINDIKADAAMRMKKAIDALETAFKKVRTGRAHPGILDGVMVPYYGADTPLNQVANVGVEDGRTLTVSPWEKHIIPDVEKALMKADLGVNPSTSGDIIRLPMPPLTEETRRDLIKVVRQEAEQCRVSIRSIRRDANSDIKELLKEKEIGEDEERRGEEEIQKLTDKYVAEIDSRLQEKEKDLMEV
ncbi:MAG: ribosome recycling factor [Ketobacteraceae bacterium]|nr:ribosome recycling factor [Ketobacteraceae bacterium]